MCTQNVIPIFFQIYNRVDEFITQILQSVVTFSHRTAFTSYCQKGKSIFVEAYHMIAELLQMIIHGININ